MSGSVKVATWPEASQTSGARITDESRPTTSSRDGDHGAPPLALDVLLQLDTQRPVVPGGTLAAVDLTAGVDEATALAQADDGVDLVGGHGALFITTMTNSGMLQVTGGCTPWIKSVAARRRDRRARCLFGGRPDHRAATDEVVRHDVLSGCRHRHGHDPLRDRRLLLPGRARRARPLCCWPSAFSSPWPR